MNVSLGESISVTGISPATVCAGSSVTITFSTTNGKGKSSQYDNNTTYSIYLSNSSGSNFTYQGIFSTNGVTYNNNNDGVTSGITVSFLIPGGTPTGDGYKISIGSTNPSFTGSSGDGASLGFTINALPTPILISSDADNIFCAGTSVTFTASSGSNYNFRVGGSSVQNGAGSTYTTSALANGQVVDVIITNASGCTANSTGITNTVNTIPLAPTGTAAQSFCSGASPTVANLIATGTAIQWYDASSGGSPLAGSTALVSATHYYASQTVGGCESTSRFDITVTVNANPLTPSTGGNQTICSGQSIPSLTVTIGVGQTADWYTAASGGTLLLAGNTSYTPTGAGTYYAEARNTTAGCVSASRTAVTLTINTSPSIASSSPGSRCGTGTVVLSATASSGTLNWYDAPSGGNYLGTGSPFTTPSISSTTTFYVEASDGSCTSGSRTPVLASIIPSPSITAGGGGSFCAGTNVSLTSYGTNITNQYWTGPNSFYSLDQNPVISNVTTAMSGTYIVTGSSLSGANLVTNGNFSSGNTGFTTEYVLAAQTSSGLNPEGAYDVVAHPSSRHSNFCSCGDHSSGSGLQMVINGAGTESVIWSQTVNVVPNTVYQFTYWVQTVVNGNDSNPSKIQLFVNGSNAGIVYTANATTGVWTQFTYNWTSGSGVTTAILDLKNENFAVGGNDFALDDIVFQQACQVTASVDATVNPTSVGGSVTGGTTVCSGSTSGLLTLSGHTGAITKWQSSVSPFSAWTDIANAATTYTSGALTQTTRFRAVVTSGMCNPANSAETTVTVNNTAPTAGSAFTKTCTSNINGATIGESDDPTATYLWTPATGLSSPTVSNPMANPDATTTYTVTKTTTATGCAAQANVTVTVDTTPPTAGITNNTGTTVLTCATTAINVTATGGGTYSWSGGLGTGASASITSPGTYTVTVTSANGCSSTSSITLTQDITLPLAFNVTGGGSYCPGGSGVPIGLDNSQSGVNYQLYKDALTIGSLVPGTTGSAISFGNQTVAGTYSVKATNATTSCIQDMTGSAAITIGDTEKPVISSCPPNTTAACSNDLPVVTTISAFKALGGSVSDNCTSDANLILSSSDVFDLNGGCKANRIYTVTDASGNKATCTQEFIINDTTKPVISCEADLISSPNTDACAATINLSAPSAISESCSLVNIYPAYSYRLGNSTSAPLVTGVGNITATFPEGITTITWTITDLCGNDSEPCTQTVEVGFNRTAVNYDDGSSKTGLGSGVQPMQTSSHNYFIDNKTPESGYTYSWGLYADNGGVPGAAIDPSLYTLSNVNQAHVQLAFKSNIPTNNYIISVIKTKDETTCAKQQTIQIAVQSNSSFDVVLDNLGNQCQAPGGDLTTISWNVTFPNVITEPFMFSYSIKLGGTVVASGNVTNITYTGGIPIPGLSAGAQTGKLANSWAVVIYYSLYGVSGNDWARTVEIEINATDAYQVSEPYKANNTDDLKIYQVPVITFE